jgi:uncharacterized circularly permuted ATP-grasp superfamily protein/uncharacterized alpha-E superfamily protein
MDVSGTTTPPPSHPHDGPHDGLCKAYVPPTSVFDEMEEHDGAVRSHWQMFVNLLDDLGPAELERRWLTARQLIHDNGVTYNVYGDPAGMDRPWNLDAIPFILGATEWNWIEGALAQRARLLDAIVADLYGPQKLIHDGLLPPELIFGHRGFLRPLHGAIVPNNRWLHFYAADVGRSHDGTLWVIGDRTQAPSGAGYALENRIVVSRALPDVFRDCRVRRLATFFRTLRDTLKSLAPHNRDNPRIVLLTPGPYNETYFEHAYLARYLGYTLVQGGDLTVRDNRVFLKTLGGLQPVDVILRRQDDDFCDQLELRADSDLGIPGLVQAIHSGNVAVANALGSGMLETPALMMFLPRLCKHLLGEELKIPSVGAYWCGDATARSHVIANLHRMVIKPTFPGTGLEPIFGQSLTAADLQILRARITACPRDYVGEEQITLSTGPVLTHGRVEPRHMVLRAHLVATQDGSYAAMPGGLTRFSAAADSMIVSMQRGGGSKDTWVLSGGPVDTFSLLAPPGQVIDISRAGGDLPSRVADNLYWLGRYVERAEGVARLSRGIASRLTDHHFETSPELATLLTALVRVEKTEKKEKAKPPLQPEEHLAEILLDPAYSQGLQMTLSDIYRIASLVRDRISIDTWRIINRFEHDFPSARTGQFRLNETLPALDRLIITFAAFGGLAMESMTRGYAWRFLDMGRRIERSLATLALLRSTLVPQARRETVLLESVLEVADSAMTYRRRYMTTLQIAPVLDLLLVDESNPRSVGFQLARLSEHVDGLPKLTAGVGRSPEERILLRCLTELRLADLREISELVVTPEVTHRLQLADMLDHLTQQLYALSDTLSQSYLSHAVASRQLSSFTLETEGAPHSADS